MRRRLAVRNPISIKIALPLDDHRKLEAFVALLAQIDKRNRANGKETKSRDPTKAKDALLGQYRKGSLKDGPIFLKQILYSYKNFLLFRLLRIYTMKSIFLFLFIAFNLAAMKAPNCYFAHQKFLAMIKTCKHHNWPHEAIDEKDVKQRQECVDAIFKQFQQECIHEEQARKEASSWF